MVKSLGVLIGGVFIGAVCAEIIRKKYPKAMNSVYAKTCEITSGAKEAFKKGKEAFKKGYENAMQSQQAAEPSV